MRIRIIDAFTEKAFRGNQAGVCVLPVGDWPDEGWMQRVAAELNCAETAFTRPLGEQWGLRWFTPATEVAMCGHATLATAHALHQDGLADEAQFDTLSGSLLTSVSGDGLITMDFPASPTTVTEPPPSLVDSLGVAPLGVYHTGDLGDLLVELPSALTVRELRPNLAGLAELGARCVIVTAPAEPGSGQDFVSRVFCPGVGIPEDPVTGSAHTALGPFWGARFGATSLVGLQASPRSGQVRVELRGSRVILQGYAVTVLDGVLTEQAVNP
ncbi:MAG: PhzF family phenazine biosynthesis protein [Hamadaea sp.]|uniref:PhzF family phenazine biosynthesis protein n=1 Tax=Hamadaea sp. TaxID=2024425 RepID=UPI0017F8CE2E|nr:PhzF family phenazine biosynthesis protein [Hamadaea sp.]NUR74478.1 PhzF family phenazine biosynthesis protein [Hamadaea sp.]NUT24075.1 PhzF family phenazine biosynthesis protein [Hamadaea sp.]